VTLPVLYDADCGFCRWSVDVLLRHDPRGRLRPVAISSPEGERLLGALPRDRRESSAHVVTPDGRIWSGGDAVTPIVAALRGPRAGRLAWALRAPLRLGYRAIASQRSVLGRLVGDR
jgi:predicted DCC family thiol-disulfide oxidoreductase YuxK